MLDDLVVPVRDREAVRDPSGELLRRRRGHDHHATGSELDHLDTQRLRRATGHEVHPLFAHKTVSPYISPSGSAISSMRAPSGSVK